MEIRRFVEEDLAEYRRVRLQALRDHPEAFGESYEQAVERPLSQTIESFRKQKDSETIFMLGAFEGEELLGTIFFRRDEPLKMQHIGHIGAMYTVPEVRGMGVGKALLERVIELARQMPGLLQLELNVTAGNATARSLYTACGFETYGVQPRGLKVGEKFYDLEYMVLRLD
jgi:ribosomal protein S18 acetylase RimI-like enzyme